MTDSHVEVLRQALLRQSPNAGDMQINLRARKVLLLPSKLLQQEEPKIIQESSPAIEKAVRSTVRHLHRPLSVSSDNSNNSNSTHFEQ